MSSVRSDFRNTVYKLCEGRDVPLLVTDMISGYLNHQDLFSINSLSRSLNAHANTVIYQKIIVDLDGSARPIKKASLLLRTLLTSKTAVQSIRSLSLAGDPLQDWRRKTSQSERRESSETLRSRILPGIYVDLTGFNRREILLFDRVANSYPASIRSYVSESSLWAFYLHILRLAPHIQDFRASSDYFRFADFRNTLQDMATNSSLAKLRSCSSCLDLLRRDHRHATVVRDWDSALLALFAIPDIQSIAAVVSLRSEAVRQLRPGGCSITRLVLHHYQIQDFDLNSLLAATPCLSYFEYHAITDFGWLDATGRRKEATPERLLGLEPLYEALHQVSNSLQELRIFQEVNEDSIHFDPSYVLDLTYEPIIRQRSELASLKHLCALTIPYATLLGWTYTDNVQDWDNILPPSLRRLVFTDTFQDDHYGWTEEDLMPVVTRLVEWLATIQPGDQAATFELHLANLSRKYHAPIRQELVRTCESHGVRCEVDKVHADRRKLPVVHISRGRGTMFRDRRRYGERSTLAQTIQRH